MPAPHRVHVINPEVDAYEPATHVVHAVPEPLTKTPPIGMDKIVPAAHEKQNESPDLEYDPVGHIVHGMVDDQGVDKIIPAAHNEQNESPSLEYDPAGHIVHGMVDTVV